MTSILPFTYSSFKKQTFSTPRWFRKPTSPLSLWFSLPFLFKTTLTWIHFVLQIFSASEIWFFVGRQCIIMTNTTCLAVSQVERLEPVIHETTTNNRWMVCLTKNYLQNIMHKNVSTIYLIHLRQNAIITFSTCHQLILSKRHNKKLFLISRSKDAVLGVILLWRPQKWPILWPPTPLNV